MALPIGTSINKAHESPPLQPMDGDIQSIGHDPATNPTQDSLLNQKPNYSARH